VGTLFLQTEVKKGLVSGGETTSLQRERGRLLVGGLQRSRTLFRLVGRERKKVTPVGKEEESSSTRTKRKVRREKISPISCHMGGKGPLRCSTWRYPFENKDNGEKINPGSS